VSETVCQPVNACGPGGLDAGTAMGQCNSREHHQRGKTRMTIMTGPALNVTELSAGDELSRRDVMPPNFLTCPVDGKP
jgi:hypothetical protein